MSGRVGEHWVDAYGAETVAIHRHTRWLARHQLWYDESQAPDVDAAVCERLRSLERDAPFVLRLAEEGTAWLGITLPGQYHVGFSLRSTTVARLASLGIEFSIEVFPNSSEYGGNTLMRDC